MLTGYAKQSGLKYPLRKLKGKGLGQIKIIVGSLHMSAFVHYSHDNKIRADLVPSPFFNQQVFLTD